MKSDRVNCSIDMVISMAIKDYAVQAGIREAEARDKLMASNAVRAIYDEENKLWTEGPDALLRLYREIG